MKKLKLLILLSTLLGFYQLKSQTTPANFYGQNAWMPDSNRYVNLGGKLYSGYNLNLIKQSNVSLLRYGGAAANDSMPRNYQYLKIVDSTRAKGMEPILQVPFKPGTYDSTNAAAIVKYINITKGKRVKYWIIGNEPDFKYGYQTAVEIASYIKKFSAAMKHVDTSIKIVGPSLSRFSIDNGEALGKVCDTLTSATLNNNIMGNIPSGHGAATGLPYIDYFSYHMYNKDSTGASTATRSFYVNRLTDPGNNPPTTGKDTTRMGWLKRRLDATNSALGRTSRPVKPVITEANICTQGRSKPAWDNYWGQLGCSSFFAGQHWCEMMSWAINKKIEWINFWSAMEGDDQGYLTNAPTGAKKSTYYHMQQMAKWFKGTHRIGKTDTATIKAFASVTSSYTAVMILNQDAPNTPAYRLYNLTLDSTSFGSNTHIKINGGVNAQLTDTSYASSTNLLIFDCNGSLAYKYRYKLADSNSTAFKQYSFSSPATIMTVGLGPDQTVLAGCCHTYTVSITPSGSYLKQWYADGTSVGSNSTTYQRCNTDGQSKTIKCVVTDFIGCYGYDEALFIASSASSCESPRLAATSIHELEALHNSSLISLAPNPGSDKITANYIINENAKTAKIELYNFAGQIVSAFNLNIEDKNYTLDCSSLASGMYFTTLVVDGKQVSTQKLIITK
jgi:hypothetical protein